MMELKFKTKQNKTLPPPNAGEEVEQQELSFIIGGDAERYRYFRRHLDSFLES